MHSKGPRRFVSGLPSHQRCNCLVLVGKQLVWFEDKKPDALRRSRLLNKFVVLRSQVIAKRVIGLFDADWSVGSDCFCKCSRRKFLRSCSIVQDFASKSAVSNAGE